MSQWTSNWRTDCALQEGIKVQRNDENAPSSGLGAPCVILDWLWVNIESFCWKIETIPSSLLRRRIPTSKIYTQLYTHDEKQIEKIIINRSRAVATAQFMNNKMKISLKVECTRWCHKCVMHEKHNSPRDMRNQNTMHMIKPDNWIPRNAHRELFERN